MRRKWLFVLLVVPALVQSMRAAEPSFADRPLKEWIADLTDKDPLIREEAIEVLTKIGAEAKTALPRILEIYEKDPSAGARRRAAVALWRLDGQTQPARDFLTADLKSSIPTDRVRAVLLLRELGVPAHQLTPTVLDMIQDTDAIVINQATALLNQLGEEAVPSVIAALPKFAPGKRQALFTFLQFLGPRSQPAVEALRDLMKDKDPRFRLAAARALWSRDSDNKEILAEFQELLKSADAGVKAETKVIVLTLPHADKSLERFYRACLKDDDLSNRCRAADALWELDPKSLKDGLPALIAALEERQSTAGYVALRILMRIGPDAKDAIPAIVSLAKATDYRVDPQIAIQTLGRMGTDAVDPLLDILKNPASPVRHLVQAALTTIGPDGLPKLAPALSDKDAFVRQRVLNAVVTFGPSAKGVLPQLIDRLKDADTVSRQTAVRTIGQIGREAGTAVSALIAVVQDKSQLEATRSLAVEALGQIGPGAKDAVDELNKLVNYPSLAFRFRVGEALYRIGGNRTAATAAMLDLFRAGRLTQTLPIQNAMAAAHSAGVPPGEIVAAIREGLKTADDSGFREFVALGLRELPATKEYLPMLIELTKAPETVARYHAALALARYETERKAAANLLAQALTERTALWRDPPLHEALTNLGPAARELHSTLMHQFRSESDSGVKIRLAESAILVDREQAQPALKWLREQLKLGTMAQRSAAVRVLCKVDAKNPDVLNWLLVQAENADANFAAEALANLGQLGENGKSAVGYLRKTTRDADARRRVRAAFALWQVVGTADEPLRVLVAGLTEKLSPPNIIAPVGRFVAAQAAVALGEMGTAATPALPALQEAKASGDLLLSNAAAAAIRKIEGKK